MVERKGPEYVPAAIWMARREKARRRVRWVIPPILGITLASLVVLVWLPQRSSEARISQMVRMLKRARLFRATEVRTDREREFVVRDDRMGRDGRRIELFNGEVIVFSRPDDGDWVYEVSAASARRHYGLLVMPPAPTRLGQECASRDAQITVRDDVISVQLPTRRYEIKLQRDGLPESWSTFYLTDLGFEKLSETRMQWGPPDVSHGLFREMFADAKVIDMAGRVDPFASESPSVEKIGSLDVAALNVNINGDLFLIHRGVQSPYLEVTDASGVPYSVTTINGIGNTPPFSQEALAVRLWGAPHFPLTVKITARSIDPRLEAEGAKSKVLGTLTKTFQKPTTSFAPYYWFQNHLADSNYFNYFRARHYRRALVFQSAMRTPEGAFVDTLGGGAAPVENPQLARDPNDLKRAISELRMVIRLRNEHTAGQMPIERLYLQIAELEIANKQLDQAKQTVRFVDTLLQGQRENSSLGELERLKTTLNL